MSLKSLPVEFYLGLVLLLTRARNCICRGTDGGHDDWFTAAM